MCQPCRQVSPWCRLLGKPFWRSRMWPPPRSSRRWPSSCPQRGSRFHPWEVVQASGCNSQHDNSCIACRNSPGWPGWSSHRSAPLACFTIRAPTTTRAGLLPAPLCRFFRRLLYSCSILSQGRLSASFTQRLGLAQPRERLLKLKQLVTVVLGVVFHVDSCWF